jgi:uncharacterized protein (DUF3084 family)
MQHQLERCRKERLEAEQAVTSARAELWRVHKARDEAQLELKEVAGTRTTAEAEAEALQVSEERPSGSF